MEKVNGNTQEKTPLQNDKAQESARIINEKTGGQRDPGVAPYGFKKDGTPKKAPGRPRKEQAKKPGVTPVEDAPAQDQEQPQETPENFILSCEMEMDLLFNGLKTLDKQLQSPPLPQVIEQMLRSNYPAFAEKYGTVMGQRAVELGVLVPAVMIGHHYFSFWKSKKKKAQEAQGETIKQTRDNNGRFTKKS